MTDNHVPWLGNPYGVDLPFEPQGTHDVAHNAMENTAVPSTTAMTQPALQTPAEAKAIDQTRVAAQFSRAATRYQQGSGLQQRCATQLLSMLTGPALATAYGDQPVQSHAEQPSTQSQLKEFHLLDLGAGPGWVHNQLQQQCQPSRFYALDLSAAMLAEAKKQGVATDYIQADASVIPLADASVDRIFSNLMLQWCPAPLQVIAQCWRVLKPGGRAVLSSLVDGSMWQLQQAFADAKQPLSLLSCPPMSYWQHSLAAWERASCVMPDDAFITAVPKGRAQCWLAPETFYAADVRGVLHHFKQIGANYVPNRQQKGLHGRGWLAQLQHSYEQHRTPQGLPLTFNVVYIQLDKAVDTAEMA